MFNIPTLKIEKLVQNGEEVTMIDDESDVGFLRKTVMDIVIKAEETRIAPGVGKCLHHH